MADAILTLVRSAGIYRIRNVLSGKCYIGSAVNIHQRWLEHRSMLSRGVHHSPHLQRSWARNGESAFVLEVVALCDPERLIENEQKALDELESSYNICRIAGSTLGRSHSVETRKKISQRLKGTKHKARSEDYRAKISAAHKGRMKRPEHMAALQEGRRRQVYTPERRAAVSAALKEGYQTGRRAREKSEIHKQKIGMAYAKLTDHQVREIRNRKAQGETCKALALEFGSNPGTISEICTGKRYRWVD